MTISIRPDFDALIREEFYSFLMRAFGELHAGQTYSPAWHVEALASKLQGVRDRQTRRLIVNVPPRHLKSLAASVALPAWLLGHDPTLNIVNVTYAQDLSEKFARDCRLLMTAPWYQALFPTRLASAARAARRAHDDQGRLSSGDVGRRRADRPRRRRHRDRRPAQTHRRAF